MEDRSPEKLTAIDELRAIIDARSNMDSTLQSYIDKTYPNVIISNIRKHPKSKYSVLNPEDRGLYLEGKCKNPNCEVYKLKVYMHVGENTSCDFFLEASTCVCKLCYGAITKITNIGFFYSKAFFKIKLNEEKEERNFVRLSLGYSTLDEIKLLQGFQWIQVRVSTLEHKEIELLKSLSPDETEIPLRRFKKRKVEVYDPLSDVRRTEAGTMT